MLPAVQAKAAELKDLCARRRVRRLAVFGSAAAGGFDPAMSDVDGLVEFHEMSPAERAESHFGLAEDMERLLGLPVDLVEDSTVRNPYLRRSVERTRVVLYEAA
jgi:predicted nucleotidyltransferase